MAPKLKGRARPAAFIPHCWTAALLVAALAYSGTTHFDIVVTLLPKYLDAYAVRAVYSREGGNGNASVRVPMTSQILGSAYENISEIFHPKGLPTLFKGVLQPDGDAVVELLTERNANRSMRMLDFSGHVNSFSPSCSKRNIQVHRAFDDFAEHHLVQDAANNHSTLYAGFEAITDADAVSQILGIDITQLGNYKQNNLFTSNFPTDVLSAQLHCAPIDSLTFQLVGVKTWLFVSPENLAKIQAVPLPTFFNLPLTDDELLAQIDQVYVVRQEPGDALYFGPSWCHAVVTEKGPNLMFNMRYKAPFKLLMGPASLAFKAVSRLFLRTFGGLPQENQLRFPLIFDDLTNWFEDCGPSKAVQSVLAAVGYSHISYYPW